jgi:amidase
MPDLTQLSILQLQSFLSTGDITSIDIVQSCLAQISSLDRRGPAIRAIMEVNPDAEEIARLLDRERRERGPRGPLHGIPILLKDNIDTADAMQTTAGSLALMGIRRRRDAFVARRLREAGVVLLGKTNMSEWANFRSSKSSSGWSARGGQALNPHVLDRSPCGSSSGSASAVAAGMAPASLGTETSGSIVCPASMNGVVGIKPTLGLTSRGGVIPVAHSQDTVGSFGRSVADAALVLQAIAGHDRDDPATLQSTESLALDVSALELPGEVRGVRVGVPRQGLHGYSRAADAIAERALAVLTLLGVEIIDPADIPSMTEISEAKPMMEVLLYEFKADIEAYLGRLGRATRVRGLADLIKFNEAHRLEEMPYFGQEIFEMAQEKGPLTDPAYVEGLARCRRLSRDEGIDAVMNQLRLDALVAPTTGPAFKIDHARGDSDIGGSDSVPAMAGYPVVSVPAGTVNDLPVGVSFIGRAMSESTLLRLAGAFEQAANAYREPRFVES